MMLGAFPRRAGSRSWLFPAVGGVGLLAILLVFLLWLAKI